METSARTAEGTSISSAFIRVMLLPFFPLIVLKRAVCCFQSGERGKKMKLPVELVTLRDSIVKEFKRHGATPEKQQAPGRSSRFSSIYSDSGASLGLTCLDEEAKRVLIERAAKTVAWSEKLYFFVSFAFVMLGALKCRYEHETNNLNVVQAFLVLMSWHSGIYTILGLAGLAFRNDYPFNILVAMCVSFFFGHILHDTSW
jgi:hypothetical protein